MSSFDDEKKGSANVSVLPDSEVLPDELRHDDLVIDPVEEKSEFAVEGQAMLIH
jgi:hypothetical protein